MVSVESVSADLDPVRALYTGLQLLGYHVVPFDAFDEQGNILLPNGLPVPADWTTAVGQVSQTPAWQELLRSLAALGRTGAWHCWCVAVGFVDGAVRVIVVRSTTEVNGDSGTAHQWSDNFERTVVSTTQAYAGRRFVLPAWLGQPLRDFLGWVPQQDWWTRGGDGSQNPDDPKWKAELERRAYEKVKLTRALGLLDHLVQLAAAATSHGKVLFTTLWFPPQPWNPNAGWLPLETEYNGFNRRTLHLIWDPTCRGPNPAIGRAVRPAIWHGGVRFRGSAVTDVAHLPSDIGAALYPDLSWPPTVEPTTTRTTSPVEDPYDRWERHHWNDLVEDADATPVAFTGADHETTLMISPTEIEPGDPLPTVRVESAGPAAFVLACDPADRKSLGLGSVDEGIFAFEVPPEPAPEAILLPSLGRVALRRSDATYRLAARVWEDEASEVTQAV